VRRFPAPSPHRDERLVAAAVKYRKVLKKFPWKHNERPKPLVASMIR